LDLPGDPTPGDPGRVRVLARSAGRMAEDAEDAHRAVRGLAGDGAVLTWLGAAGDVFRGALDDFPPMLDKLHDSYDQAADALRWWAGRLEDLQAGAGLQQHVARSGHRADLRGAAAHSGELGGQEPHP
jgi:uncharacterized protein YukE